MTRFISMVIGVVIVVLGVWGVVAWWDSVLVLLRGLVAIVGVLLGVGIILFGLSELWAGEGRETPPSAWIVPEGPVEPA